MSCFDRRQLERNRRQPRLSAVTRFVGTSWSTGRPRGMLLAILMFLGVVTACRPVDDPQVAYDPATLAFSGPRALEIQGEFVSSFPQRASGEINNELAAQWIRGQMTE